MSKEDYYETLGVSKASSNDEIKQAYRKKAMKYHPDRNKGDKEAEKKFKKINEAYYVLKDEEKKAQYDQFGHQAFENGGTGFQGFKGGFSDIFEEMFGDFDDDIGSIFGGRGGRKRTSNTKEYGSDLRYDMDVSLEEIFSGKKIVIHVPTKIKCKACDGKGHQKDSQPENCPTCEGHGAVRASQGFFTIQQTCPDCRGHGKIIKNPCSDCTGQGRVDKKKSLSVEIPAGVEDGTRIRLTGEGEAGYQGGPPGDLYIFIKEKPNSVFKREGENLFCRAPITMTDAALGGNIEVPTLDGSIVKVKIPPGTQSGSSFRLSGKGMPIVRQNGSGDLYLEAFVETPVNLSSNQKELLKKFSGDNNKKTTSPQSEGFFDRLKDLWKKK
ncbi:MAG: Chaperone protein DnaJ [Alphaproteobacteria bacterium MarineAlpha6_Bin4]|nr:MAG: Chaperone protein DnaJ [Alphaproteobacteria bacterium MarineAlpha6_Bin3]PPR38386.1 MAG: Chaperone protein DnaJ [Alphaproteobacteria bacterium MarineAlpha6_Bin4]|tara:strand:+ start:20277 stop:21422 length:1146 start_codon:yes stop_codon:yes gene_type:complete